MTRLPGYNADIDFRIVCCFCGMSQCDGIIIIITRLIDFLGLLSNSFGLDGYCPNISMVSLYCINIQSVLDANFAVFISLICSSDNVYYLSRVRCAFDILFCRLHV